MVELLPGKHKVLSSIPSNEKKKLYVCGLSGTVRFLMP
jgi:hypothetical protein